MPWPLSVMSQIEALPESAAIDGPLPVPEYRAISLWAMLALVLGLLSPVAVLSPILGIVPLVAIAIGCYALRRIHVNSDRLSGRWLAVAPLILAPLFLGWGFSREFSRRERFFTHAREFADDWLSILNRNEPYFAHQLWVQKKHRLDPHMNFEVAYQADESATNQFKMFMGTSPAKEILAAAPNAKFQFEEFLRHRQSGLTDVVTLQYTYDTPTAGKARFWITVKRDFSNYTGRADWQITDFSVQKPRGS